MEISAARIGQMLDEHVVEVFGKNFSFRTQQRDIIIDILYSFMEGTCNLYLLDAPTGSGKSVIAIITASFLSMLKMKGYILTSDLSLQTQYEKDIEKHKLNWGSIKGVDNYDCVVNHEKFSIGECRIKNRSYPQAESLPCFSNCGYLFNRRLAINSNVSILNYSYWLVQQNYVSIKMDNDGKSASFPKRDFTFCDEAHKITDIVQNHFSPRIDQRSVEKLEKMRTFLIKQQLSSPTIKAETIKSVVENMFFENDPSAIYSHLKELEIVLKEFLNFSKQISAQISEKYSKKDVPKEWKYFLGIADWIKDVHCKFEDYNHIIQNVGLDNMIKQVQGEQVIFNCLDESYMMERHFHSKAGFKLLMTATMGDPKVFLKTIGASNARYTRMNNHFNYEKSPIYFYPNKRMSMSQREKTIPWATNKIDEILSKHYENGIIHSGSYELSDKILKNLSSTNKKRILVYKGSQEKAEVLERFMNEKNLVLMGPSILEGLDLFAEKSRFQIFAKVPYPSLGDKFVSAKMKQMPAWYSWKATCGILQGIGRSVRSEDDWCKTYFLDGCLSDLLRKSRSNFPPEFLDRIKIVNEQLEAALKDK